MATAPAITSTLGFRHIFGVSNIVTDNISVLDENKVAYIAGHSLVVYDKNENRQHIIQGPEVVDSITSLTVSLSRKHAAVSERGDRPKIHVFDLTTARLKKTLVAVDVKGKELVCMQFSEDDQMLLCLTGFPDYTLLCWNWMKGKLIASLLVSQGTPMNRCTFNPSTAKDPLACVSGKDSVKFFRISDRNIRLLKDHNMEGTQFTSHLWMRETYEYDSLIASTEAGELLAYRSGEFITRLACSPGLTSPISCMHPFSSGFIMGSKTGELIVVHFNPLEYLISKDHTKLKMEEEGARDKVDIGIYSSQFTVSNVIKSGLSTGGVLSMSLCPVEEHFLAVLYSDNQILTMPAIYMHTLTSDSVKLLSCSFHAPKPIVGLDICVRKPIIITCSADNTLRLWDFNKNTLVIQKYFPEDMLSVTIHPSGLHCAIGFTDRLRLYHILVDDLKMCLELPIKNCRESRFNDGGSLIAAVNGNGICVYDFYRGEKIADLKGHNSKVRSLHWLESGHQLLSSGQDGAIYLWDVDSSRRIAEFLKKGVMYTSVVHTKSSGSSASNSSSVFAVGSDRVLKELSGGDLSWIKDIDADGFMLNQLAIAPSKKALLASTSEPGKPGFIRLYSHPIENGDYTEYPCLATSITRLCLSSDENFVVAADEAGCFIVYELHDRPSKLSTSAPSRRRSLVAPVTDTSASASSSMAPSMTSFPELMTIDFWSDEVLIPRTDLEERSHGISDLRIKLREQKFQNDFKLKLKDTEYTEHTKQVTEKFLSELELARVRLDQLREERIAAESKCVLLLKEQSDSHQFNVQNFETKYQSELMNKVDAYHSLMRKRDAQRDRLDDQRVKLKSAHERYLTDTLRTSEMKLEEGVTLRKAAEVEKEGLLRLMTEMQSQLEDDIDTEIEHLRKAFNDKLTASRETTMKYKGQLGINKKKCLVVKKEMEEGRELMAQLYDRERDLHEQIINLEKEIGMHKKEIKSRDVSIGEKEKRVYELKKKNQELDKFKFVLDFKIRELKQQIEPRQKEIADMKNKIKQMDDALENYHLSNSDLDAKIGAIRQKIEDLHLEIKNSRMNAKSIENSIHSFCSDVNNGVMHIMNADKLLILTVKLIAKYGNHSKLAAKIEEEVEGEFTRHKDFLSSSVSKIRSALTEEVKKRTMTNKQLMHNNMEIINDINARRSANRSLKNTILADIGRMRHYVAKKKVASNRTEALLLKRSLTFDDSAASSSVINKSGGDPSELLERNRTRIQALRAAIANIEGSAVQRTLSRETLPPLESILSTPALGPPTFKTEGPLGEMQSLSDFQAARGDVQEELDVKEDETSRDIKDNV